jgi:methylenetetrahydrofolate dehydrogenase (NADP+)/methenyltetrahydrofolate cyclohydrolase
VLVGDDPGERGLYERRRQRLRGSRDVQPQPPLPADISQADLLARRRRGSTRIRKIHGILVQMPLPKQIDPDTVIRRIDPPRTWTDFIR